MGWDDPITEKQRNYIKGLIQDQKDEELVSEFLGRLGKPLDALTRREASELIGKLLERPVKWVFKCGLVAEIPREDANRFRALGELEACLHACPKHIDVHECEFWLKDLGGVENARTQV